jgi:hypothetical protein
MSLPPPPIAPSAKLFEANLAVLAARLPGLAALLRSSQAEAGADARLEVFWAASGQASARLGRGQGGRLIHSAHDPRIEAGRLASAFPPAADTAIVLGFGLGYGAEALLAGSLADRVIVCEASAALLAQALAFRDLREVLGSERLGFLVGGPPEALAGLLDEVGARRLSALPNQALERAFPDWYGPLRAAADRYAAKEGINENTLRRFGRLWVRNLAHNLPLVGSLPGTRRLEARFEGLPALVLAAGPSLDAVLPSLPALRDRLLIICVDTALRSVLRTGIEPDFLLVVDPQYWNWRHLEGLSSPSSILVSESAAWPAVFRFSARARFLCSSLFPLGQAIEARAGAKGRLGAGGSVATTAWDLARVLGAKTIYMAGLDLGFPSGKTHAEASLFEQRALSAGRRLCPAETSQAAALLSGGPVWAKDAAGRPLRSDQRMALYAWWFESRFARSSSPPTLRLGDEGLAIPGLGTAALDELLALPPARAGIDGILGGLAALAEDPASVAAAACGLAELLDELAACRDLALSAAREAAAARVELSAGLDVRPRLARLDEADARLIGSGASDIIGFLLPPLAEILGGRARDLGEGLVTSEGLYRGIADSASYHIAALERGMARGL